MNENPILERNLTALLRRYEPVLPREAFRLRVRAALLEAVADDGPVAAPNLRRSRPAWGRVATWSGLTAAIVLAVLGVRWLFPGDPNLHSTEAPAGLEALLAAGEVASRSAPDAAWTSGAPGELNRSAAFLEVATPGALGADVRAGATLLALAPDTHITLTWSPDGQVRVDLHAGALEAEGELRVHALACAWSSEAWARFALDSGGRGNGFEPPLDPQELHLALTLERTGAWRDAEGRPERLPAGRHLFQDGVRLRTRLSVSNTERRDATEPGEPAPAEATRPTRLVGVVRDLEGRPVESFLVWTRLERPIPDVIDPVVVEVSDPDGAFAIELPSDDYTVMVAASGHAMWKRRGVHLEEGQDLRFDVHLERGLPVQGQVVDGRTGAPLADALVVAEYDLPHQVIDCWGMDFLRPPLASARTDSAGAFTIPGLTSGTHQLRVSAPGFAPSWPQAFHLEAPAAETPSRAFDIGLVELQQGGSVEGVVLDSRGWPVPEAELIFSVIPTDRPMVLLTYAYAVTGTDGRYRVDHLPAGGFVGLTLRPDGTTDDARQLQVREGEVTSLDFQEESGQTRVVGVLLDDQGQPLADYKISLAPRTFGFEDWMATSTDEQGRFELVSIPPGPYGLMVSTSFTTVVHHSDIVVPEASPFELPVTLPATVLRGIVRITGSADPSTLTLILMRVEEDGLHFHGRDLPRSDGSFRFPGLRPGTYELSSISLDPSLGSIALGRIEVREEQPAPVEFTVGAAGRVEAQVLRSDGRPAADALVHLIDEQGDRLAYAVTPNTDLEGRTNLPPLAAGRWTLVIEMDGERRLERSVVIVAGQTEELLLQLR